MPNFEKNKSTFMMKGKSPMMKALIGNQNKLPKELQEAIKKSPAEMKYGSPMDKYTKKGSMATFKSDAQRKAAYASGYKGKGK